MYVYCFDSLGIPAKEGNMKTIEMRRDGIMLELRPSELTLMVILTSMSENANQLSDIRKSGFQKAAKDFYVYIKMIAADWNERHQKGNVKFNLTIEQVAVFDTILSCMSWTGDDEKIRVEQTISNNLKAFKNMVSEYKDWLESELHQVQPG